MPDPVISAPDEKAGIDEEQSRRRRLFWLRNLLRGRHLARLFASRGEAVMAVGAATVSAGVLLTAAHDAVVNLPAGDGLSAPRPSLMERVATLRRGNSVVYPLSGRDGEGRAAAFELVALTRDYTWIKKQTGEVEKNGEAMDGAAFRTKVVAGEIAAGLAQANTLIAVGLASAEGDRAEEQDRALRRARQLAQWLSETTQPGVPIWTLNLGQYKQECAVCETSDTSWQRPIVIIGVKHAAAGVNLGQALADAMNGRANLPSANHYSLFALERFR